AEHRAQMGDPDVLGGGDRKPERELEDRGRAPKRRRAERKERVLGELAKRWIFRAACAQGFDITFEDRLKDDLSDLDGEVQGRVAREMAKTSDDVVRFVAHMGEDGVRTALWSRRNRLGFGVACGQIV